MKRWLGRIGLIGTVGGGGVSSTAADAELARTVLTLAQGSANASEMDHEACPLDGTASWLRLNPVPDLPLRER